MAGVLVGKATGGGGGGALGFMWFLVQGGRALGTQSPLATCVVNVWCASGPLAFWHLGVGLYYFGPVFRAFGWFHGQWHSTSIYDMGVNGRIPLLHYLMLGE